MSYKPYKRTDRLNELLKEEISQILQRELKDPRIGFVTVTRVEVSPDLSWADVYFSVLGEYDPSTQENVLNHSSGFVKGLLGRRIRIKKVPNIRFHYDDSLKRADRVLSMLNEMFPDDSGS